MALIRDYQQTGNQVSLDLAAKNAQFLLDTRVERDGAWFFQYEFDWTYVVANSSFGERQSTHRIARFRRPESMEPPGRRSVAALYSQ